MKKVALIGATGEVGYRLISALHSSYKISAVIRNLAKRDFSLYPGVEIHQIDDISNIDSLSRALEGCDAVINTGYIWFAKQIHLALRRTRHSVSHILFTGSTGIYTTVPSYSADRKRAAEQFIRENYPWNWTIIRPTMIYGHKNDKNISRLVLAVSRYPVFPLIGNGGALIQPILIHDLVKAYELALFNPKYYNSCYNIGGGKAYSNRELISCVISNVGKKVVLVPVPAWLIRAVIAALSLVGLNPISPEQVDRFLEDKNIDLEDFISDFGYVPTDFESGIQLLIQEMEEQIRPRRLHA